MNLSVSVGVLFLCVVALACSARVTTFNIEDYGADFTGRNDSTTAIQTAVDLAGECGGTVVIPPGSFKVTSTIKVTLPVSIQGVTPTTSQLVGSSGWLMNIGGAQCRGIVIQNLGFLGTAGGTDGLAVMGAFMVSANNLQFTNLDNGLWIQGSGNVDMMSITVWSHTQNAVRLQDLNGDIFLDKVHANTQSKAAKGLYLSNVSGAKITNSDFIGGAQGVFMDLATNAPNPSNEWVQFLSVDCDTVANDPWHIVNAQGLQLSECWSGTFLSGTGIWLGAGVNEASIVNHQWQNGYVAVGNNSPSVSITGGIMANVRQTIESTVDGEPTVSNLRIY